MIARALILWNLAPAIPIALALLWRRRYVAALLVLILTPLLSLLWPLPPVPAMAALTIALSLRRCWQLATR